MAESASYERWNRTAAIRSDIYNAKEFVIYALSMSEKKRKPEFLKPKDFHPMEIENKSTVKYVSFDKAVKKIFRN